MVQGIRNFGIVAALVGTALSTGAMAAPSKVIAAPYDDIEPWNASAVKAATVAYDDIEPWTLSISKASLIAYDDIEPWTATALKPASVAYDDIEPWMLRVQSVKAS